MLIAADRVLFPDIDTPVEGYIDVREGRIVSAGQGPPPRPADEHLSGILAPGYVDVHSHGGGGASFITEHAGDVRQALAAHRARGTTTMVASLVTGAMPDLERQVAVLAELVDTGELAGIHLEGPWLAAQYKGAHPEPLLVDPHPDDVSRLLAAGRGTIRMVTMAPERAGAVEAIRLLASHGVVVSVGHTAADFDTVHTAIDAGARGATHLFNAMPPLRHRAPGPVLALWQDPRVYLELIWDGVHLDQRLAAFVLAGAPDRTVFVTDAMGAAGAPDGDYILGELAVEVRGRVARVAGTDTIAGSTLTLDLAVRNAVNSGVPLAQAVRCATQNAADYLGLVNVGRLIPGSRADAIVLDDELHVARVLWRGDWQSPN